MTGAEGHRNRLRERYLRGGPRSLSDRDMLELLLTYAIPRRDVKQLARELLSEFGSLRGVLSQPPDMLTRVEGIGPASSVLLSLVHWTADRAARERDGEVRFTSPSSVREYIERHVSPGMTGLRRERLEALLLDSMNRLIATGELEYGTVDRATVHPRNLVEKVIATGATGVILVHNHPGGSPGASREDAAITRRLGELGRELGFRVLDHLIVADGRVTSLLEEGLLD